MHSSSWRLRRRLSLQRQLSSRLRWLFKSTLQVYFSFGLSNPLPNQSAVNEESLDGLFRVFRAPLKSWIINNSWKILYFWTLIVGMPLKILTFRLAKELKFGDRVQLYSKLGCLLLNFRSSEIKFWSSFERFTPYVRRNAGIGRLHRFVRYGKKTNK